MTEQFFQAGKFSSWDKISITFYLVITTFLWYYFEKAEWAGTKKGLLFSYAFGTQMLLYLLNYRSLRNLSVYLFWITIGLFHLFLYFHFINDPALKNFRGHSASGFKGTIILLVLFQGLRWLSIKLQGKELVAPSRSKTDLFEEREVTFIDILFFFIYFAATTLLNLNLTVFNAS